MTVNEPNVRVVMTCIAQITLAFSLDITDAVRPASEEPPTCSAVIASFDGGRGRKDKVVFKPVSEFVFLLSSRRKGFTVGYLVNSLHFSCLTFLAVRFFFSDTSGTVGQFF